MFPQDFGAKGNEYLEGVAWARNVVFFFLVGRFAVVVLNGRNLNVMAA